MKALIVGLSCLLTAGLLTASELETKFQALQTAVSTSDPLQVKAAAVDVYGVAKQAAAEAEPAGENEFPAWKERVEYGRSIELQAEYALYTAALKAKAATAVDLFATLEQLNPSSKYLEDGYATYFADLTQVGQSAKILPVAQKAVARFPRNADVLLVVADNALVRKQNDAAISYAKKITAALAGTTDARKSAILGRGYYIAGIAEAQKNDFSPANRDLRAALPLLGNNEAMLGPALFYLGVTNYQLGKQLMDRNQIREAGKYSERAATMRTPFAAQAAENARIIKTELEKR